MYHHPARRQASPSPSPSASASPEAPKQAGSARKRAAKACLACRSRKIRCDVASCGPPCTRCGKEGKNCLVVGRASRLAIDRRARLARRACPALGSRDREDRDELPRVTTPRPSAPLAINVDSDVLNLEHNSSPDAGGSRILPPPAETISATATEKAAQRPATVLYAHLPFLTVGNIHKIPAEDVNHLESQGCFHVPARPLLDNFVQQHFLHVHPLLPVVDEGEFWEMYSDAEPPSPPRSKMSLVLFQSIIFNSCTYVPLTIIQQLGFSNLRSARAEFYRRVRLLYDLDTEIDPLPLAQASLLLMNWVPPSNFPSTPYRMWLERALRHAKSINADRFGAVAEPAATCSPAMKTHHKACRRLWWCCIIYDRVSPLVTRHRHRITRDTFDFSQAKPLGAADLEDEIYRSSVYSPAAKRRLIGLFETYLNFTMLLTDVLDLVYPFEDSLRVHRQPREEDVAQIETCDAALKRWFNLATTKFLRFQGAPRSVAESLGMQELHRSEALHINMMYIYYYTAKIAIHHYLLLDYISRWHKSEATGMPRVSRLEKSRDELLDAVTHMTVLVSELSRRRLLRWLPTSTIACIATPLALNLINATLPATGKELVSRQSADVSDTDTGRQELKVLVEALEIFLPQYEGVSWVRDSAKYAASLARTDGGPTDTTNQPPLLAPPGPGPHSVTGWTRVLTVQPSTYIRAAMTVDLCISKGRVPDEEDFPAWMLSRLSINERPIPDKTGTGPSAVVDGFSTTSDRQLPLYSLDPGLAWPWSFAPQESQPEQQLLQLGPSSWYISPGALAPTGRVGDFSDGPVLNVENTCIAASADVERAMHSSNACPSPPTGLDQGILVADHDVGLNDYSLQDEEGFHNAFLDLLSWG